MKIGILGATGAVGRQMLECIEERNIACDELAASRKQPQCRKGSEVQGQ